MSSLHDSLRTSCNSPLFPTRLSNFQSTTIFKLFSINATLEICAETIFGVADTSVLTAMVHPPLLLLVWLIVNNSACLQTYLGGALCSLPLGGLTKCLSSLPWRRRLWWNTSKSTSQRVSDVCVSHSNISADSRVEGSGISKNVGFSSSWTKNKGDVNWPFDTAWPRKACVPELWAELHWLNRSATDWGTIRSPVVSSPSLVPLSLQSCHLHRRKAVFPSSSAQTLIWDLCAGW